MRIIRTHEDIEAGLSGLVMLDARLGHVVARAGPVPLRRTDPGYRGLASIIVSQMVSKASAAAIWRRMEEKLGEVTAAGVNSLSDEDCRAIGLSRAKAEALRRVAEVVVSGQIDLDAICNIEGSEAIRELTAIKGWGAGRRKSICSSAPVIRMSFPPATSRCKTRSVTDWASNCARAHVKLIRSPLRGRPGAASPHASSGPIIHRKCVVMLFL